MNRLKTTVAFLARQTIAMSMGAAIGFVLLGLVTIKAVNKNARGDKNEKS
jgi:hypothetical protein